MALKKDEFRIVPNFATQVRDFLYTLRRKIKKSVCTPRYCFIVKMIMHAINRLSVEFGMACRGWSNFAIKYGRLLVTPNQTNYRHLVDPRFF